MFVGGAIVWILQNPAKIGVFVDRVNPKEAFITDGGGHTFGG